MSARERFWLCLWVVVFSVATACLLLGFKHRAVLDGLQRDRLQVVASEVRDTIERSLTFGMALAEIPTLPAFLDSQRGTDPLIDAVEVADSEGRVLYAARGETQGAVAVSATARNAFGLAVARVAVRYRTDRLDAASRAFARRLAAWGAAIAAGSTLVLFLALGLAERGMAGWPEGSRRRPLAFLALMGAGACAAIVAAATLAHRELQRDLPAEAVRKAEAIGRSIDALSAKAMRHALPLERLPGIDELLRQVERKNPEIGWIAMRSGDAEIASHGKRELAAGGPNAVQLPLITTGDPAVLQIVIDPSWVATLLGDMALDLAVIAVVAVVISMEMVFYLARGAARGRVAGTGTRGANVLGAMRAPFFLFLLSEDLSRSFLPLFARSLPPGALELPAHLVTSLPITIFMLIVALSQPALGTWSERIGRRRAFLGGAVLGAAAQALSANAGTLSELLLWRSAAGLAWAVAFVAAQGFVIDHTDRASRTRGLASFVGIIMAAMICGPSIGGLLADGLGPRWTFAIAAGFAAAGALAGWRELPREARERPAAGSPGLRGYAAAVANPRFASLLLLAAIPAKIIVIAFCFYLLPLYVAQEGHSAAAAGRIIMLYSVMMVLLVPVSAELVERIERVSRRRPHAAFVAGGLALSGLAGISMLLPLGLAGAAALALVLGVAQAMSIAPQSAMVPEASGADMQRVGESAIYGVYRLVERLGNAAGPIIAAYLLVASGFQAAFAAIGAGVLASGIAFYAVFRYTMKRPGAGS